MLQFMGSQRDRKVLATEHNDNNREGEQISDCSGVKKKGEREIAVTMKR